MNNLTQYIGKPYAVLGRGPDEFDCWGLVMHFYEKEWGVKLPNQPVEASDIIEVLKAFKVSTAHKDWMPTETPVQGSVVVAGRNRFFSHAGVYIEGGHVLHTTKEAGASCVQSIKGFRNSYQHTSFFNYQSK